MNSAYKTFCHFLSTFSYSTYWADSGICNIQAKTRRWIDLAKNVNQKKAKHLHPPWSFSSTKYDAIHTLHKKFL